MSQAQSVGATFTSAANPVFILSTTVTGNGTVTSAPAGINCGTTCSASFTNTTTVTLTATPSAGSVFSGWSGACTGTGTCSVLMSAAKSVTATFALTAVSGVYTTTQVATHNLSTDCWIIVSSKVYSVTAYISTHPGGRTAITRQCGKESTTAFNTRGGSGTHSASAFSLLNGLLIGTIGTAVGPFTLTTTVTGSGTITSAPTGISCGATCSASYANNTVVALTATPSSGFTFTGWTGACTGTGACSVTMSAAKSVGAIFTALLTYSTNFDATENPISETNKWIRAANSWTDVRTSGGIAFGTNGSANLYDDSYAILSGYTANQEGEAVIARSASLVAGVTHEAEILLRMSNDTGSARGYECSYSYDGAFDITRWDGAQGGFTSLSISNPNPLGRELQSGDTVKCSISGNSISSYINGALMGTAVDTTYTTGQPGIGFFTRPGGDTANLGFTSYTARTLP